MRILLRGRIVPMLPRKDPAAGAAEPGTPGGAVVASDGVSELTFGGTITRAVRGSPQQLGWILPTTSAGVGSMVRGTAGSVLAASRMGSRTRNTMVSFPGNKVK